MRVRARARARARARVRVRVTFDVLNSHGAWIQRTLDGWSSCESHRPSDTSSPGEIQGRYREI